MNDLSQSVAIACIASISRSRLQGTTQTSIDDILQGTDAPTTSAAREALPECGVRRRRYGCTGDHWDE
ncbi:hypothetical protein FOQG_19647 [Fusarium oxysporum f. sp. raphani 54005]|uniref:Uncharacterized protein n=1 Tax=Fusarium oxysporum f. sp. raphani 54005 TaxID=1089458 RepID=X0BYG9_FUSOX|nr:hypothetical protein FOQG_19647 [Fusarium oxysporum f. sp. raphani 54005]